MKNLKLSDFGWGGGIKTIWDNFSRHGLPLFKRLTLKRFWNIFLLGLDWVLGRSCVFSRPVAIKIEPCNMCNYHCPGCYTGSGNPLSSKGKMSLDVYKKIIDEMAPYALKIIPHMWGEPLIHPDIFEMITYGKKHNLQVQVSSNLNLMKEGDAERFVDSKLDQLTVPVDGATQETYEIYRQGGNLNKVLKGIQDIMAVRKAKNASYPKIELQFIVFDHNVHEHEAVKKIAEELNVDIFTVIDCQSNRESLKKETTTKSAKIKYSRCMTLWILACFDWNGSVSACCDSVDDGFGNITEQDFGSIWNSPKIQKARAFQKRRIPEKLKDAPNSKCLRCRILNNSVTFHDLPLTENIPCQ